MLRQVPILVISFFLFFFISCNPDEDDILGLDLIEDDEFLVEKHQFSSQNIDFNIKNFQEQDVSGSGSYNLLGTFNDLYFGQSDAAFFMQVLLPSNNIDFEASEEPNIKLELSLPLIRCSIFFILFTGFIFNGCETDSDSDSDSEEILD